jgi:predicted dinucleotide-utilizing enzyme
MEEIIKEVALKNHRAYTPDDPVMVLVTIVGRLAEDMEKEQKNMLQQYSSGLQELALDWRTHAKDTADKILNASLEAGKNTMAKMMQEGTARLMEAVDKHINDGLAKIRMENDALQSASRWAVIGGAIGGAGGLIALAAALLIVLR